MILQHRYCKAFVVCFFLKIHTCLLAQGLVTLPRSTPAAQGVEAAGISRFLEAVKDARIELHSLMMLRHGKVIAEAWWHPYRANLVHTMYSTSKSFTSAAVGFAIAEGLLKTDDKVMQFFRKICRQFIIVMPEQDAVIAITCETADMQAELDLVWKYLLPAMKQEALPENVTVTRQLKQQLNTLALLPTGKSAPHTMAPQINGKTFRLAANDDGMQQVSFSFRQNRYRFILKDKRAAYPFDCGLGAWVEGRTTMPGTPPELTDIAAGNAVGLPPARVAASYAWKDSATLEIVCRYIESPHHEVITCHFNQQEVTISFQGSLTAMVPSAGKRSSLNGVMDH